MTPREALNIAEGVCDLVAEANNPEDVFDESVLEDWARENGWVKASEVETKE